MDPCQSPAEPFPPPVSLGGISGGVPALRIKGSRFSPWQHLQVGMRKIPD